MHKFTCVAGLVLAATVSAQSPLTTTYAGGNGLGAASAIYFDVVLNVPLTFTQIDVNSSSTASTSGSVDVLWCSNSYVGNDINPAAWTLGGTGPVIAAGSGVPTPCTLSPFTLPAGNYGFCVVFNGIGQNYTNGNGTAGVPGSGTNETYSTTEMTLLGGASAGGAPGTAICCDPRVFNGSIYYSLGGSGTVATRSNYGTGCYDRFASFYESFATSAAFDLTNNAITMLPTGSGYTMMPGITAFVSPSPAATALTLIDDSEAAVALTTPFAYDGGVTSSLTVCSNGYVSVATGNGTGYLPSVATFLAAPQTGWWCWHDMNPAATGSGQVKFEEANGIAYVTFDGVYDFAGTSAANANTFQFQFDTNTGAVHMVFQTMSALGNARLVGYSPGGASMDPQSLDISATLPGGFSVGASDAAALSLSASARPVLGTSINLDTNNIPAGTLVGATLIGFSQVNPGIDLSVIGMPGCFQYVVPTTPIVFVVGGTSATVPLSIPNNGAFIGLHVYVQSATFTSGLNAFGVLSSNGVDLGLGNL